jgi:hypothetical protein
MATMYEASWDDHSDLICNEREPTHQHQNYRVFPCASYAPVIANVLRQRVSAGLCPVRFSTRNSQGFSPLGAYVKNPPSVTLAGV